MSLRGVITSDWHLGGMNRVLTTPTELQMKEIHKPFKYALEHGIKNVFVPGDASDKPVLSEHEFIALLTLLLIYDEHLNVWYLLGNHDVEHKHKTSMDVLRLFVDNGFFKNFRLIYTPEIEKVDGVYCALMPFPHLDVLECRRPPVVFAHIETVGALGDNGHPLKKKKDDFIRQPGDFVFSGHIHKYQHLVKRRFVYCGSPYQKNFGEDLPKGFVEFEARYINGRLKVDHEHINSKPGFRLETVVVKDNADWERLSDNPRYRYRLLVDRNEVTMPKNITTKYPNIVQINGIDTTNKVEMAQVDGSAAGVTLKNLPKISMKTGLLSYLKHANLTRDQRMVARDFVEEAFEALSLQ